jgi:hypothetical protein
MTFLKWLFFKSILIYSFWIRYVFLFTREIKKKVNKPQFLIVLFGFIKSILSLKTKKWLLVYDIILVLPWRVQLSKL